MIRTSLHHPRNHLWVARRQTEIISKTKQKKKTRFFLLQTVKVTLEVDSYIPSASSSVLHLVYLYLSSCNRQQDCYKKDKKREIKSRKNENFPAFPRLFVISSRLVVNKKRVKKHVRAKISGNQWAVILTVTDFRSPPSVENGVSGSRGLGSKRKLVGISEPFSWQWPIFAHPPLSRMGWAGREVWVRNVTRSIYCVLQQDTWPSQCLCASQCLHPEV